MMDKLNYYIDPMDNNISLPNSDVWVDFEGKDNFMGISFAANFQTTAVFFTLSKKLVGCSH